MIKIKYLISIMIIISLLVSCSSKISKNVDNSKDTNDINNSNSSLDETQDTYSIVCKPDFKGKKQINILIDDSNFYNCKIDSEIINAINKKLDKDGYNFAVNFEIINPFSIASIDYYEKSLNKNKIFDIVSTGSGFPEEVVEDKTAPLECKPHENTYWECVNKGYLIPLNKYLKTSYGKKLYNQFPKNYWNMVKDNQSKIYGVYNSISSPNTIIFMSENEKKYNYNSINFNGDILSLEETLKRIKEKYNVSSGCFNLDTTSSFYEYFGYSILNCGIYINEKTGNAENLFENKEYVKYYKKIKDDIDKGYLLDTTKESIDDEAWDNLLCSNSTLYPFEDRNETILCDTYMNNDYLDGAFGITSSSKHPDEAFTFLYLMFTNSEYATLLQCGIKDRNYTVNESGVVTLDSENTAPYDCMDYPLNPYITDTKGFVDYSSKEEKQKILELQLKHTKKSKAYGFSYPKSEKTNAIKKIYEKYEGLYYGAFENIDENLKKANDELKKAGIDEVLTDVNRQLDEFHNGKSKNK